VKVCTHPPRQPVEPQQNGEGSEWNDLDWEASPPSLGETIEE
jgi:hypothetical protein